MWSAVYKGTLCGMLCIRVQCVESYGCIPCGLQDLTTIQSSSQGRGMFSAMSGMLTDASTELRLKNPLLYVCTVYVYILLLYKHCYVRMYCVYIPTACMHYDCCIYYL